MLIFFISTSHLVDDDQPTAAPTSDSPFWDLLTGRFKDDIPTSSPVSSDPSESYEPGSLSDENEDETVEQEQEDREEDKEILQRAGILPTEESDANILAAKEQEEEEEKEDADDTESSEVCCE